MAERIVQQFGNYRLLHLLGRGGFADVYLGSHIHLGRQVAVKVLHPRWVKEESERFRMEARTIARLEHPHIVRILDFDVQDGTPFLVMNYVPNGTLRQRHPQGTRLPLSTVVSYIQQTASALQYAHEQRVIHRDIKPENLLIGHNREIILSDFGIALVLQNSLSLYTREMAGTIAYMAPEQIGGRPNASSDQYALSVLAYEWLSGERPFNGTVIEVASKKCIMPAPPLREKLPYLSPAVEEVVMTGLAMDPCERFATVQDFAIALERSAHASAIKQVHATQVLPAEQYPPVQTVSSSEVISSPLVVVQDRALVTPMLHSSLHVDVGQQEISSRRGVETELPSQLLAQTQLPIQPSQRGITRRAVVISTLGLAAVGGMVIPLSWISRSSLHQPSSPTPTVIVSSSPSSVAFSALDRSANSSNAMFGFDLQHTHFNPKEQRLSPNTVPHLVRYWVANTGAAINSSPAVAGGVVYVGSDDGNLYAFSITDGTKLWAFLTTKKIVSSPAVTRSTVYIGSEDGQFYAIDASTGQAGWPSPFLTGGRIDSSPVVADGIVYIGSNANNESLYAINASTGQKLWTPYTNYYPVSSSPAVSNGVVYFGSYDGQLYALKATTGEMVWKYPIGSIDDSSPAVAKGIVYIGGNGGLYAINTVTGKQIWNVMAGCVINSSPAVANGVVYIGSDDGLYALNAVDGTPHWSTPTVGAFSSSPTVANGVVYIGSGDGKLYAINASDGKSLWSASIGKQICSSPAVVDGVVYVGSDDHNLYAFHLPNGGP